MRLVRPLPAVAFVLCAALGLPTCRVFAQTTTTFYTTTTSTVTSTLTSTSTTTSTHTTTTTTTLPAALQCEANVTQGFATLTADASACQLKALNHTSSATTKGTRCRRRAERRCRGRSACLARYLTRCEVIEQGRMARVAPRRADCERRKRSAFDHLDTAACPPCVHTWLDGLETGAILRDEVDPQCGGEVSPSEAGPQCARSLEKQRAAYVGAAANCRVRAAAASFVLKAFDEDGCLDAAKAKCVARPPRCPSCFDPTALCNNLADRVRTAFRAIYCPCTAGRNDFDCGGVAESGCTNGVCNGSACVHPNKRTGDPCDPNDRCKACGPLVNGSGQPDFGCTAKCDDSNNCTLDECDCQTGACLSHVADSACRGLATVCSPAP